LVLTTDYTVSLNADQDSNPGGNVTLLAVLATGFNMIITSDIANLQPTDLTNQGGFYPEVITDALDRATIQIQQMADELTRSIKIPVTDGLSLDMELPTAAARANSFLAFDATGEPTVVTAGSPGAPTTMTRQQFSGTGSQVAYTLASDPGALGNSCEVFVGGIYQQRDTYTIAGTTLTFTAAPVAGTDNIEVVNFLTTAIGTTDSSLVTYVPAGTGATQRTVQAKLRDVVSVKDFGAVGDGVADDAAAITAAIATGKAVYLPTGTYKVLTTIVIPTQAMIFGDGKVKTKILAGTIGMTVMASTTIVRNACIRDFTIEPASLSGYGGIGLLVDSFAQCHIENIQINGFRNGSTGIGIKFLNTFGGCYFNNLINLHLENSDTALLMTGATNATAVGYMNFSNLVVYQEIDCIVMLCPYLGSPSSNTSIYNYFDIIYIQGNGGVGYGFKCEGSANSVEVLVIDQGASMTKNVAFLVGAAGTCQGNQIDRTFGVATYENTNVTGAGNGMTTDVVEKTTVSTDFLISRKDLSGTNQSIMRLMCNSTTGESKYILGNTTNSQAWSMGCSTTDPNWILAKGDNTTSGKFLAVDYVSGTIGIGGTTSTAAATTSGFVGAKNGIYFAQTGVPPTGNGPYLYVDAGALKFKGGSGTVTTIAVA
jgi:hypothetical protein